MSNPTDEQIKAVIRDTLQQFSYFTDGCGCCSTESIGTFNYETNQDEITDETVSRVLAAIKLKEGKGYQSYPPKPLREA